ncbi:DUF3152 domain-containing protein [Streptomyces cellulosae]|uniref:DUF3152 domain-containing protein n=1 Tax=Streptomyces cellulosae TaxID=1968 RepID=A0ABW7XY80_STRCE
MGRHSRRGPAPRSAPKGDSGDNSSDVTGGRNRTQVPPPRYETPPRGAPRAADGTPAGRAPRFADGTPAQGVPRLPDGTPARGTPRHPDGTPAHGIPRLADGTPARGVPQARGGHPEQRENGGGWGQLSGRPGAGRGGQGPVIPRQRPAPQAGSGPRQDYLDAFAADADEDVFVPRTPAAGPPTATGGLRTPAAGPAAAPGPRTASANGTQTAAHASDPYGTVTAWPDTADAGGGDDDAPPTGKPAAPRGGKGRTFTGVAAAAVTTVLAIVVAGQVADGRDGGDARAQSATDQARDARDSASRVGERPVPSGAAAAPLTYEQKMGRTYALGATLKGSGKFDAIPGVAKAPGKGQKFTYRVDVEQGLGLDGELFAEAVQKTLNDDRSWAHNGARTFERIYSGKPDFVITLASPGTTAEWCAKSGLDTTVDNVSCDSAATERVMINAYRWARGSTTYGDQIHAYRQMLINHEVGHRLGYGHVSCDKDGELAPVMQQQTKFLDHDGIHCKANPWPFPGN